MTKSACFVVTTWNMLGFMHTKPEYRPGVYEAVKTEADQHWVFGLEVEAPLGADARAVLYDLVVLRGGTLHPDGWITLPKRSAVPGLIDAAAEIGVRLSASVRRR
jgi:hypothetical protein